MIAPNGEEGKHDTAEEEEEGVSGEDVDVEILYMRLKALQSMKEKLDQEDEEDNNENQIVEEMQELLDEADQAAEEVKPLVDIDEAGMDVFMKASMEECNNEFNSASASKADPMVNVVKRLKEAARKTKQQVQEEDCDYSPTQSPIRDVPVTCDFDLDQINPQSPVELDSLVNAAAQENKDDLTEVKMEIDPLPEETEAETNFFKQQMEDPLFPASVWEFQKKSCQEEEEETKVGRSNEEKKVESATSTLEAYHSAVMAESKAVTQKFRRKRARSRGKSQTSTSEINAAESASSQPVIPEEEEEDENALRAAVLTSMAVKRAKKEEALEEKVKSSSATSSNQEAKPVSLVVAKKLTKKVSPKKLTLSEKKRLLEKRKSEVLKKAKGNKDRERLRLEIERLNCKDNKPIKNKSKVLPLIRKHFPNMFMKRVIIPAKDLLEDSCNAEVGPPSSSTQFMRKLDTLMKDLRGVQAKKIAPPKRTRAHITKIRKYRKKIKISPI